MHDVLATHGIFIETSIVKTPQGIIYQISTRDYEFLDLLQKLYKPLANYTEIITQVSVDALKPLLVSFLDAKGGDVGLLEMIEK